MWLSQQGQKSNYHYSICDYLKSASVNYTLLDLNAQPELAHTLNRDRLLSRGIIFEDAEGMLMAIVPYDDLFDIAFVNQQLQRELELVIPYKLDQLHLPNENTCAPPLSEYFGLPAIIDESIISATEIVFNTGIEHLYLVIKREVFLKLQNEIWYEKLSLPIAELTQLQNNLRQNTTIRHLTPLRMKQRLKQTFRLPAMPAIAGKILKLRFDPKVTVTDLTNVIQTDPSLSAQLLSWVQSPYHGWRGKITTVDDAVTKILGYDLVVNLTLMTALGQTLNMPLDGQLGLRRYWLEALTTAMMVAEIVEAMPADKKPPKGLAYLAGLLHNFGHFVLAQLFPSYFSLLNQLVSINPNLPVPLLERYAFGVGHDQVGVWLMENWYLPSEIIVAAKFYRQDDYQATHAVYANLVQVARQLNARIANPALQGFPLYNLDLLGIDEELADTIIDKMTKKQDEISTLTGQ